MMYFKVKEQENFEKAVQLLRLAGIEVEIDGEKEDGVKPEIKEVLVYEDRKYFFECPYCQNCETFEPNQFQQMFNKDTHQITCHCGGVSAASFCDGEMIER